MSGYGKADKDESHRATRRAGRSSTPCRCASTSSRSTSRWTTGGEDAGPDPQELLAVSLASCTAITMEMYAARKGWDIGHVEVDVRVQPRRARLSRPSSSS